MNTIGALVTAIIVGTKPLKLLENHVVTKKFK